MNRKELHDMIDTLPNELLDKVSVFLDSIAEKKTENKLSFVWKDSLKEFKNNFTSTDLQHKATEWR